jgi:hypothetical protein
MASKGKNSKNEKNDFRARQMRRNQIIIAVIAAIVILSMTLSMIASF